MAHARWFSPPQSSRDVAHCGALLFFSRPVAGCPCLASSSLAASCGASPRQRASRRMTRERQLCVTGGSRCRSRARTAHAVMLFSSSSLVLCAAPRAPLPRSTCAPAGARAPRADARRTQRATRRARRAGSPSAACPRSSRSVCFRKRPSWASLLSAPLLRARSCYLRSVPRDHRRAGARGPRAGARRTRAERRTRREGIPREGRFPLSRLALRACSLSLNAAPSLPAEGARSARAGMRQARDPRVE